jgi:DNA-binding response OmpR family regulator
VASILLVEDDAELARLVESILALDGHEIAWAGDGDDACRRLQAEAFDLLLLDVGVPGVDGIEICRRARETEPRDRRATIIMITGRHQTASKLLAFSAGADDYLVKPLDPLELRTRVARWVDLRGAQSELVMRRRVEAINEIVAAFCHEFNNPLAAAVIGVDLVLKRGQLPKESAQAMEVVYASLEKMEKVLRSLATMKDRSTAYVGGARMTDLRE